MSEEANSLMAQSYEPTETDSINKKLENLRDLAREYAQNAHAGTKADKYGNFPEIELSDVKSMFLVLLGNKGRHNLSPYDKIEIFSVWLDMEKNNMSEAVKSDGLMKLQALINSAENHKFLDESIEKYNNRRTNFFDKPENREKYISLMQEVLTTGTTLTRVFEVVYSENKSQL